MQELDEVENYKIIQYIKTRINEYKPAYLYFLFTFYNGKNAVLNGIFVFFAVIWWESPIGPGDDSAKPRNAGIRDAFFSTAGFIKCIS